MTEKDVCFFDRGTGPLVSCLIPSRGNPKALRRAVESLIGNARNPSQVEVILKIDDGDGDTRREVDNLRFTYPTVDIDVVCTPRGRGYFDIHNWLNMMAARSHSDWLFILNDDSVMETQYWDELLCYCTVETCWHNCPQDVFLLWVNIPNRPGAIDFFLLRRKVFEMTGQVCGSPYGDAWVKQIMELLGCTATAGILTMQHERDPNREGRYTNSYHDGTKTLASVGACLRKIADASRLLARIEQSESAPCWMPRPVAPGWQRWRASPDHDPTHVFVTPDGKVRVRFSDEGEESHVDQMGGYWQART